MFRVGIWNRTVEFNLRFCLLEKSSGTVQSSSYITSLFTFDSPAKTEISIVNMSLVNKCKPAVCNYMPKSLKFSRGSSLTYINP